MNPTTILQQTQTWPVEDRLELAFGLWDQLLDGGWKPELTDELRTELNRRLSAHQADPENVLTWEQIVQHVRRQR